MERPISCKVGKLSQVHRVRLLGVLDMLMKWEIHEK